MFLPIFPPPFIPLQYLPSIHSEAENIVTQSEGTHYLHILFTKGHLSEKNFVIDKHAQINAVFLQAPAGAFSHGSH